MRLRQTRCHAQCNCGFSSASACSSHKYCLRLLFDFRFSTQRIRTRTDYLMKDFLYIFGILENLVDKQITCLSVRRLLCHQKDIFNIVPLQFNGVKCLAHNQNIHFLRCRKQGTKAFFFCNYLQINFIKKCFYKFLLQRCNIRFICICNHNSRLSHNISPPH